MVEMVAFVLKSKHESTSLNLLQVPLVKKLCLCTIVETFLIDHQFTYFPSLGRICHLNLRLAMHVVVLMLTLLLGRICSFICPHSLKSHLTSLQNAYLSWCVYSLMSLAFLALPNILASYLRLLGIQ
jgi:hypothetical protein